MKYKKVVMLLASAILIFAGGCSNEGKKAVVETEYKSETEKETKIEIETEIETEEPTTEEAKKEIEGLARFEWGERLTENKDVSKIASLIYDATYDGRKISIYNISEHEGDIFVTYVLVNQNEKNEENEENEENEKNEENEFHISKLDGSDLTLVEDVTVTEINSDGDFYTTECTEKGIRIYGEFNNNYRAVFYDFSFKKIYELSLENVNNCHVTCDEECVYYLRKGEIYKYIISEEKEEKLNFTDKILAETFSEIYTDNKGEDYIFINGRGSDLKTYEAVYNVENGELLYLDEYGKMPGYNYTLKSRFISEMYANEDGNPEWTIYDGSGEGKKYIWNPDKKNKDYKAELIFDLKIMENGDIFATRVFEDCIQMCIFSAKDDSYVSTDFAIPKELEGASPFYMTTQYMPYYLKDGSVVFALSDGEIGYYYYQWKPEKKNSIWDGMEIKKVTANTSHIIEIYGNYDPKSFVPGEVSDKFAPLRKEADEIEKKYNIEISIEKECTMFLGGYALCCLDGYESTQEALKIIDKELAKYPKDFFEQLKYGEMDTLHLYLTGTIVGLGGGLDYAGGIQTDDYNEFSIAIDCQSMEEIDNTLHHELSHVIDDFLIEKEALTEEEWNSYNVTVENYDSLYTMDYSYYGYDGNYIYTYFGCTMDTYADVCFIDDYSMTYPTEDRARIWEYAMAARERIDWTGSKRLGDKLKCYSEAIRKAFNTENWDKNQKLPWEFL